MNIVITGASAGIGYETVKKLSLQGHAVLAIARRHDKLEELRKECIAQNPQARVHVLACDITTLEANVIEQACKNSGFDDVSILINNAGHLINKSFIQLTKQDWHDVYAVNVFAAANLIRLLHPFILKAETKHIVNISSMGGIGGSAKFPGLAAYSSSKGAIGILTECLAEEFKDSGIVVNALALGAVKTEMLAYAFPDFKPSMTAGTMADFVSWFALNGSLFFNGKIIPVANTTP
jgi:NAD(P)-dependent dehydrogenase (short-subunit alcohol dehydrogenase family)